MAKSKIPSYLDSAVSDRERQELRSHLRACRSCADTWERTLQVRDAVRSLPRQEVPKDLVIRLRVMASQERHLRIGLGRTWWEGFTFRLNGLLRPLAVPLAGGICAAVVLFAALVPTLSHPVSTNDVPCVVFTQPMLEYVANRVHSRRRGYRFTHRSAGAHRELFHRRVERTHRRRSSQHRE